MTQRRSLIKQRLKYSLIGRLWPRQVEQPVFVVGCPRSGTTIFGRIMEQAPGFTYRYEPKIIWALANPELDVWQILRGRHHGRLHWAAADATPRDAAWLGRAFHYEQWRGGGRRLVEKTPLNVMRIEWMHALFPSAKFIHLVRHARDVALSLEAAIPRWYPAERYPPRYWSTSRAYGRFRTYASGRPELWHKLSYIAENARDYLRGLFVWRCAVSAGREAGKRIGPEHYMELRYETLVTEPERTLRRVFDFLAEPLPDTVSTFAKTHLKPASVGKPDPQPELTEAIAGDLLRELGYTLHPQDAAHDLS